MSATADLSPPAAAVLAYYEAELTGPAPKACAGLTLDQFRAGRQELLRKGLLERSSTGRYRAPIEPDQAKAVPA